MRTIDLPSLANSAGVIKELAETNAILRSDMRTLLNGFCKSYSPKPETCDVTIPAPK
ncbi:hypothetical protein BSY19_4926 (plasmid) [Bosea sp. RAC05]|nr:hypothetical protein BSY19_4926 [Bosea sp. RAC05]